MMHKALHPNDGIDSQLVSRKGRIGVASIEYSVDASIQGLEKDIKKSKGSILVAA